jgi:hypothetical protein
MPAGSMTIVAVIATPKIIRTDPTITAVARPNARPTMSTRRSIDRECVVIPAATAKRVLVSGDASAMESHAGLPIGWQLPVVWHDAHPLARLHS